jgi:hypothetical protein
MQAIKRVKLNKPKCRFITFYFEVTIVTRKEIVVLANPSKSGRPDSYQVEKLIAPSAFSIVVMFAGHDARQKIIPDAADNYFSKEIIVFPFLRLSPTKIKTIFLRLKAYHNTS